MLAPLIDVVALKLDCYREKLEDESVISRRHHKNFEFLIHYYENGGKPPPSGKFMWILDGKIIDKPPEKIPEGSALWPEMVCLPFVLILLLYSYFYLEHRPSTCTV